MNAQEAAKKVIEQLGLRKELFRNCESERIGSTLVTLPQVQEAVLMLLGELTREEAVELCQSAIPHLANTALQIFSLTAMIAMMSKELETEEKKPSSSSKKAGDGSDGPKQEIPVVVMNGRHVRVN